jgi:signal transduction histidine kinase
LFFAFASFAFFEGFEPSFQFAHIIETISMVFIFFIPLYLVILTIPHPVQRSLIDSIDQTSKKILITDELGVIKFTNRQIRENQILKSKVLRGMNLADYFEIEFKYSQYEELAFDILNVLSQGQLWREERMLIDAKQKESWFEISILPLESKAAMQFIIEFDDITEKKEREFRIFNLEKFEAISKLSGGLAHELNNILMTSMGYTDLAIIGKNLDEKTLKHLEAIKNSTQQAADIIHQLILYTGNSFMNYEDVNLNVLIIDTIDGLRNTDLLHIEVQIRPDVNIPKIRLDQNLIGQGISNIIQNAIEAMTDQKKKLQISTGVVKIDEHYSSDPYTSFDLEYGEFAFFEVIDNGVGLEEKTIKHIFDPFYTTNFPGRGLGLAVVHGIVRAHGGVIQVKSKIGSGTSMRILLPIEPDETEE